MKSVLRKAACYGALLMASAAGVARAAEPVSLDLNVPAAASDAVVAEAPATPASENRPLMLDDAAPAAAPTKKITGSIGFTVPTKYISRGLILNNDRGVIFQPQAEIDFNPYTNDKGYLNAVQPYVGIWNDVVSNGSRYTTSNHLSSWYELDWYVGVRFTFLQKWKFDVQYIEFTSPASAFHTAKNIIPQLSYDDSDLWKNKLPGFALNPYIAGLIETSGKAGSGRHLGQYIEPGIVPTYVFLPNGQYPLTVTVPTKVGLGVNNFYGGQNNSHNETFGYFTIGVNVAVPLKFIDRAVGGTWSANAGAAYYYYGDGTHYANQAFKHDRNDAIAQIGLSCGF